MDRRKLTWADRRNDVKRCSLLLFCLVISYFAVGGTPSATVTQPEYRLQLFHTHTAERLDLVYRRGDHYIPEALLRLDWFMRDHRTGAVRHYDPRIFDLLHDINGELGRTNGEIDIVCGYRSPWSNEFLRAHGHGVAAHSLHMQAAAIDIRMPGITTSQLRDAALTLHRGGVGYYAASEFVHVDVGRVRRW